MTTPEPLPHDPSVLDEEGQKILSGLRDLELDPAAVDYLYNANPLVMTKAQRAVVIETVRRYRAERTEKKVARAAKKTKLSDDDKNKLSLDDLGDLGI